MGLVEVGNGLVNIAGFILALYPVILSAILDILIFFIILKTGGNHPFLTGMLYGFALNNSMNRANSLSGSYTTLVILAPINAVLAVLIALHLGMPLVALIVGVTPLAALALLGVGVLIEKIGQHSLGNKIEQGMSSMYEFLKNRKPAVAVVLGLGLLLVIGMATLIHLGQPHIAFAIGFAAVAALIVLGTGYVVKNGFKALNNKIGQPILAAETSTGLTYALANTLASDSNQKLRAGEPHAVAAAVAKINDPPSTEANSSFSDPSSANQSTITSLTTSANKNK